MRSSDDGTDVALGTQWVTQAQWDAFDDAISAAKTVQDNESATQAQVDGAATALNSAITVFNAAKQPGTLAVNRGDLDAKIAEAELAITSVTVADAASAVAQGMKWATQMEADALQTAIDTAKELNVTSQAIIDGAVTALNTALTTFNTAVTGNGAGSKTTDFSQADFDALIAGAKAAKTGVVVSTENGDDVPPATLWVSQTALDTLNTAISTAEAATLSDAAYLALSNALKTFYDAKTPGTTPDNTDLLAAITSADEAKEGVVIAASASVAAKGSAWVTQTEWDALDTAYTDALAAATQNEVTAATTALTAAVAAFTAAKTDNGPGTAVNGIAITGLGSIYKTGTAVSIRATKVKDGSAAPVKGTVTSDGTLTVTLPVANGSYYISFTSDSIIAFISKTTVDLSGTTVSKAFGDFEQVTYSMNFGDMNLSSSMTLDAFAAASETDYAGLKSYLLQMMKTQLNTESYVNATSLLDVAFYKNEACTQEFAGPDTVGPDTALYTKFPLQGWDDEADAAGYIAGTVTLTGGNPGQQVQISAQYSTSSTGGGNGNGRGYTVSSDGSFAIPFAQDFLTALESGSQYLHFSLSITSGNSGFSKNIASSKSVTKSQVDDNGNLDVGSLGTVSIATITLSGTISVTYEDKPVPQVQIRVDDQSGVSAYTVLTEPGPNAAWSIPVPVFASPTNLTVSVSGRPAEGGGDDGPMQNLFGKDAGTVSVFNTDVPDKAINLGNISK